MELAEHVSHPDATCVICGYSLTGLPAEGRCPECGTPVEQSFRGSLLEHASPEYLARLHKGVFLILAAIIVSILAMFLNVGLSLATGGGGKVLGLTFAGVGFVTAAMSLIGWWLFSAVDPGYTGREQGTTARSVVRAMVIVIAVWQVVSFAYALVSTPSTAAGVAVDYLAFGIQVVAALASVIHFFASMLYVRWLAPRIPNPKAFRRAKTLMWLGPLLMTVGILLIGLGPLIALVLYWNMLDWIRKDLRAIRGRQGGLSPA